MELAEQRYQHWCAQKTLDPELRQELAAMQNDADKITDAFYRDLEFGTAGLRGVLGAGTNRMNIYVIRRATQAVADYLNETDLPKTVAIGHDSRIKSDVFAREAAEVFAANGITAYLYPRLEPVPALSFAVRHLGCGLGICVTASHNPAAYNGYKVYGSDGCQMTPEAAKRVVALLEQMDYFTAARTEDFDAALAAGRIRYIPDEVLDAFVDAVYAQRVGSGDGIADLKLVYTPLNGAGLECVRKLTQKLGIRNMTIVKEQEQPDGHFPTCPYPNPEIRQAMELGLQYCDRVHPDILIGTDPDCDRCGTAVPDGKGGYRLISGNEMGVILLDFICRSRIANGTMPENPVAVTTIVSTDMVTAVANKYGVELRRVLTGFKYIGEQIALLEAGGHPERGVPGTDGGQPAAVHDPGHHRPGAEGHAGRPVRPPAVHCRGAAGAGVPGRLPPLAQCLPRRGHHGRPQARGRGLDAGRGRHLHCRPERRGRRRVSGHRQLLHRRRPREC